MRGVLRRGRRFRRGGQPDRIILRPGSLGRRWWHGMRRLTRGMWVIRPITISPMIRHIPRVKVLRVLIWVIRRRDVEGDRGWLLTSRGRGGWVFKK